MPRTYLIFSESMFVVAVWMFFGCRRDNSVEARRRGRATAAGWCG